MSFRGVREAYGGEDSGGQIDMGRERGKGKRTILRTIEDNTYSLLFLCPIDMGLLLAFAVDCRRLPSIDMGELLA